MKPKIIKAGNLRENNYGATKVTDILNSKEWPYFSIAKVRKTGNDVRTGYDKESNVVYYVLEGKSSCFINGKKYYIQKGDCVILPKGTKYKNLKGLTLLAISYPRFDRKKRVYID